MRYEVKNGKGVVQTIPADLSMMFIVGLVFSWQTARLVQKTGHVFVNKYFGVLFLFQTFVLMPQAVYYYVAHPGWCWMYWMDSKNVSTPAAVATYLFYYVPTIAGYTLGFSLEKKKPNLSFSAIKLSLLFLGLFALVTFNRLFYVGTLSEFQLHQAKAIIFHHTLFILVFGGMAISIAFLLFILRAFGKELDIPYHSWDKTRFNKRKKPAVSVKKVTGNVKDAIRSSLLEWNGLEVLQRLLQEKSGKVFIKPNFSGGGKDKKGTQTSPEVLSAVIDIVREIQPDAEIFIIESGSIFWWDMTPLMKNSVYENLFKEKDVRFVDLTRAKKVPYDFGGRMGMDEIPEILLEPHVFIDSPVAKTHAYFKMSGALKNLFGLTPSGFKLFRYHAGKGMDDGGIIFLDIYRNFPPDFVIVDGTVSCEGHGPLGTPKETNFIMTSNDAPSADFALSEIMGYKQEEVPYLKTLMRQGYPVDFDVTGEPMENIKPPAWKRTDKLRGLSSNFFKIFKERLAAMFYLLIFLLTLSSFSLSAEKENIHGIRMNPTPQQAAG